jgi:hypothetical protein
VKLVEMLNVVCSADVNIPQFIYDFLICDVHFGDTRND